jgi:ubiquitin C-terminal hydrolase
LRLYRGKKPWKDINKNLFWESQDRIIIFKDFMKTYKINREMWEGFVIEYGSTYVMESFPDNSTRVFVKDFEDNREPLYENISFGDKQISVSDFENVSEKEIAPQIEPYEKNSNRQPLLSRDTAINLANTQLNNCTKKYEFNGSIKKMEIPPIGLKNYGANCYVNAGIQCLCCIPEMNIYFLEEKYREIDYVTCKNIKICEGLTNLYCSMCNEKDKDWVTPKDFVSLLPSGQQDAHEFLFKKLFPNIEDETNPKIKKQRGVNFDSKQNWEWYTYNHRSILDYLFAGQFETRVECQKCKSVSVSYDPFLDISLPVTGTNLRDCLISNFETEILLKDNMYLCEKCQKVKEAHKTMKIDRCPKYLLLHLKRLLGKDNKISNQINYPMDIDISK